MMSNEAADPDEQVVKRFVRYALACENQRKPIRRADILERGSSCASLLYFDSTLP